MAKHSKLRVLIGTSIGMMIAGLPFLSKNVREREQAVHQMRDDSYEQSLATKMAAQKDEARNARLSIKKAE